MLTKTGAIARAVIAMTGRGHMVFNDRLTDGRRSLKVWGWTDKDYETARELLTRAGCQVRVEEFKAYSVRTGGRYTQRRLHIQE
jgi:hypothetical protein